MSRIRANNIVNGAGTGAPTFPNGAVISGIATINADIDSNSNITVNQITSLQSLGVGTGATVTNPADNELAFNTNGTERVRVDSSGNVGIGTEEPTKALHISQNSDVAIRLQARNANVDNTSWEIVVGGNPSNDAEMVFRTRNDAGTGGSEIARFTTGGDLKFPSGGGIDFSATADGSGTTTSEVLDDYEEGTWTPVNGNGTGTFDPNTWGRYTRIGHRVWLSGYVKIDTMDDTTNTFEVDDIPFAPIDPGTGGFAGTIMAQRLTFATSTTTQITIYGTSAASGLRLYGMQNNASWALVDNVDLNTGDSFYFSISYEVA
ncbi:hypothetical protein [Synechococcus phage S-B43]|nr:hypothetical protein [Synechococcus phage S-B43]